MTLAIKTIHQDNDGFNNVEKVSGFVSKEPTVALRHLCLYVSVSTVEKLNLKKFKRVRFSVLKNETFENAEKLYIRPNNDDDGRNRDNYLIVFGKKQLSDGAIISGVKSLYRAVPKLKKYSIKQLCKVICPVTPIRIIGMRPGEKMHESMFGEAESLNVWEANDFFIISSGLNPENYNMELQQNTTMCNYSSRDAEYIDEDSLMNNILD